MLVSVVVMAVLLLLLPLLLPLDRDRLPFPPLLALQLVLAPRAFAVGDGRIKLAAALAQCNVPLVEARGRRLLKAYRAVVRR